ncbi:MAG: aspartate-semialdehyde dehydrogenase [Pseudomonadota bacterium]
MSKTYKVAVAGATGAVGRAMLDILAQRQFPVGELALLASARSAGTTVEWQGQHLTVQALDDYDFAGTDLGLFSAGGSVSAVHAPRAAQAGCLVVDNTSEFRYRDDVPLVVAEVNPHALANCRQTGIVANPNCSTMQLLVALAPLHREAEIERINIATYQSVSGAGQKGIDELVAQSNAIAAGQDASAGAPNQVFGDQIAFNVVPHIDRFEDNGYTREEMKLVWETQKILEAPELGVNATAVRVPVVYGHAEAVHLETRRPLTVERARELLAAAPGVTLMDQRESGGYPTPATHAAGTDPVFVGRIRQDLTHSRGLNLWVVSDNVRKGAALNTIQLAELLVKSHL